MEEEENPATHISNNSIYN